MAGKKGGRRVKPPVKGKRNQVGLSLTSQMKARLDHEAFRNGVPVAAEVEARLRDSFTRQDLLTEVMALAFGEQTAALLQLIGYALQPISASCQAVVDVGPDEGHPASREAVLISSHNWLCLRSSYDEARAAITTLLDALSPPPSDVDDLYVDLRPWAPGLGKAMGARALEHLVETDTPRWRAIRAGLDQLARSAGSAQ
jgi:hypothetical protein